MISFYWDKTERIILYVNNILVDPYQEKAILCPNNCLLVAGAGAGKTFTILGKLNYLLENKIYKENEILLISFTNKSVNDLKKKIKYNLDIYTFHKLAMNILKDHQKSFEITPSNTLDFITDEFFQSLKDPNLQKEILIHFKEYEYDRFLKSSKYQTLKKIIISYICLYKTNDCTKEHIKKSFYTNAFLTKLILIIMKLYDNELTSSGKMDFDDLIKEATLILKKPYKYKYIIIDEFQDTSFLRWHLVEKLLNLNHALLFAVGDDFQSIYHFSGCNVNLFLDFDKIVPNASILKLKYTYRNSQQLIDIAGKFILKNKRQMDKELKSHKSLKKPVHYINYINPQKALTKLLDKLILKYDDILILQRNNKDITKYLNKNIIIEETCFHYKNKKIRYLTVHSSKGLEADVVILINLTNKTFGFPNQMLYPSIIEIINKQEDNYPFAEERRLFYVALTRTKNEVYLLTPLTNKSIFIKELKKITKR